jgi:hypothetical protein
MAVPREGNGPGPYWTPAYGTALSASRYCGNPHLTKAQGSRRIDELQEKTGRGAHGHAQGSGTSQIEEVAQESRYTGA